MSIDISVKRERGEGTIDFAHSPEGSEFIDFFLEVTRNKYRRAMTTPRGSLFSTSPDNCCAQTGRA